MPRRLRTGLAFCAAIATAVTVGACGSGLPGNAVVQIGNATITKAALIHWLDVANDSSQVSSGAKAGALPLPPDYTACVAEQRKAAGNTKSGNSASATAAYKSVCAQTYQTLLTEALRYLIFEMWIQGEAADRGFKVTQAAIDKGFAQERKQSSPSLATTKELNAFMAASGQTIPDLKWRTMVSLLTNKIVLAVQKRASKVTDAQSASYYHKHLAQYKSPETRDLQLVLVPSLATAGTVKSLLAGGSSYTTVAAKYSVDAATKSKGGQMLGVSTAELTPQLSTAVFAAKVGTLSGPTKTAFGYYVFTVDKITPGTLQSFAKVKATIKATIAAQQEQAAESALQVDLQKKWQPRTKCRSGYVVAYQALQGGGCAGATVTGSTGATAPG